MIVCEKDESIKSQVNWNSEVLKYKIEPIMDFTDKTIDEDIVYYFDRYVQILIVNKETFDKLDLTRGYCSLLICAEKYEPVKIIERNKFKNLNKYKI